MPGWAVTTEVLYRGRHPASTYDASRHIALTSAQSVLLLSQSDAQHPSFTAHASLAATAGKVFRACVQREVHCLAAESQGVGSTGQPRAREWQNQHCDDPAEVWMIAQAQLEAVVGLDKRDQFRGTSSDCSTSDASTGAINESGRAQGSGVSGTEAGRCSSCNTLSVDHDLARQRTTHHHLQVTSLVSLAQVCGWIAESKVMREWCGRNGNSWLGTMLRGCERLVDPDLRSVASALLESASSSLPQVRSEVAMRLELYAVTHLDGRLLPGCCHAGCTNLDGVTEAAMKTLLCAGCKKARYCSVECQRVAWSQGGHSRVCGS